MKFVFFMATLLLTYVAAAQTITRNTVVNSGFISPTDIIIDHGTTTTVVRSASLETPKKITFIDPVIVLERTFIKCDQLEFTAAVNTVRFSKDVNINCRELLLPVAASNIIFENSGQAQLTLIVASGMPASRNITINDAGGFKVTFVQK